MQPRALPPILRSDAFSVRVARQAGVSLPRLRRSDLEAPFRGVRVAAKDSPTELVERCRAYRQIMAPDAVFSHGTAARLLQLPLPANVEADPLIDVAVIAPARSPRMRGIRGHQLVAAPPPHMVRGLPIPHPAEVWCQLGRRLSPDELVVVGDSLVRRKEPLIDPVELRAAVARADGRPGIRAVRSALDLVRARTDSPMETRLRLAIVQAGLPEPVVNYLIAGPQRAYHLDLAYPRWRVAIEYDGDQHRTDRDQYRLDMDRLWQIERLGWRIVRLNHSHVAGGAHEALRRIRVALPSF